MAVRKGRKRLYKRAVQPARKSVIRLREQAVSGSVFSTLPESDKYALLLLGHVFQEIAWLQRMLYVAQKNTTMGSQIEKDGQVFQLLFLTRMLLGKLKEFDTLLREENRITAFLASNFDSASLIRGTEAVRSIREKFSANAWISTGRNKHFLHYPKFNDMKATLSSMDQHWDYKVYHGEISSLTLYTTSDAVASLAWFNLADQNDPFRGHSDALDTLLDIAREVLALIERAIGHQLSGPLARDGDTKEVTMSVRPLSDQRFDYFCSLVDGQA